MVQCGALGSSWQSVFRIRRIEPESDVAEMLRIVVEMQIEGKMQQPMSYYPIHIMVTYEVSTFHPMVRSGVERDQRSTINGRTEQ
jgi:hypothetical protein